MLMNRSGQVQGVEEQGLAAFPLVLKTVHPFALAGCGSGASADGPGPASRAGCGGAGQPGGPSPSRGPSPGLYARSFSAISAQ
eukprot:scaffold122152_cov19-Tisochrysis_lutea.AAC.1